MEHEFASITLSELAASNPGRVAFTPHPAFDPGRTFHPYALPLGCYRADDMVVVGAHGVILTAERVFLREQNFPGDPIKELLITRAKDDPASSSEVREAVSLASPCTYCFFHWVLDSLPKVLLAERCGFTGSYLLPFNVARAADILETLGIARNRLIPTYGNVTYVERLCLPTHFISHGFQFYPAFHLEFREWILAAAGTLEHSAPKRIFLDRKSDAAGRRIVNGREVLELLHLFGFERIWMEDHPFTHQVALAAGADAFAGPHGAGMLHTLFMKPRSTVIEFFSPAYVNYATLVPSSLLGHRYRPLVAANLTEGEAYPHGLDIHVPTDMLRFVLDQEFAGRA